MDLPAASRRLISAAQDLGLGIDVRVFPEGTKTAPDAAAAVGCPVAAIVKSLVFVIEHHDGTSEPVLVLMPGDRRLDTNRLAEVAEARACRRATLDEVREATGYAAGGTPPFGHASHVEVYADSGLRRHDPVWAAGGTPTTVFPISPGELDRVVQPTWADLAELG